MNILNNMYSLVSLHAASENANYKCDQNYGTEICCYTYCAEDNVSGLCHTYFTTSRELSMQLTFILQSSQNPSKNKTSSLLKL